MNKPVPPTKPFAPKQFTHYHAKKPKHHFHHNKQKMYRQEPDRVENLESLQGDIIPNAIEYILSRNFLEDGIPRSDFNLLDSFDDKVLPSYVMPHDPLTGVLDHRIETYELKNKFPTCMTWTPNGNRILVGNSKGKISMIDSTNFSQHEVNVHQTKAVKALGITHNNKFMLVGDEEGAIKYFDSNYKEVREVRPSAEVSEGVKEISFAPTDAKFVTANDKDKTLRIWDLENGVIDKSMIHGNDIHCCQWHPYYGLIASGSKDATIKFWDPNSGEELASLINHANSINCIKWNSNGNWLLSCARDQSIRMYDLRMVKEIQAFTGIDSEVEVISWSPFHERLFASGTKDGTISFWLTMESSPVSETKLAHFTEKKEQEGHLQRGAPKIQRGGKIVELAWNPVGDVLASCGNDKAVKFWGRPRDSTREFQQLESQQMGGYGQKDVMDNSIIESSNQY